MNTEQIYPADMLLALAVKRIQKRMEEDAKVELYPHQVAPDGDWRIWMLMGGRMCGKTFAGARWTITHLREMKEDAWCGVVSPTRDDVKQVCFEGESGLYTLYKDEFKSYNRSDLTLVHKRGGKVRGIGGEKPDRLRGPQFSRLWIDEFVVIEEDTIDNALLALRLGDDPRALFTSTPKRRELLIKLLNDERVMVRKATSFDNKHVNQGALADLQKRYGGTRLGRQELQGELIEDVDGALFKRKWIERARKKKAEKEYVEILVIIDPATTQNKKSAETGIAVAASCFDGSVDLLASAGVKGSPDSWAKKTWALYDLWGAGKIAYEKNQGGDFIKDILTRVRVEMKGNLCHFKEIHASRSKAARAEPVSLLMEQGKIHFVGYFPELEDQLCNFIPGENQKKMLLDRFDSFVHAVRSLKRITRHAISAVSNAEKSLKKTSGAGGYVSIIDRRIKGRGSKRIDSRMR